LPFTRWRIFFSDLYETHTYAHPLEDLVWAWCMNSFTQLIGENKKGKINYRTLKMTFLC